MEIAFSDSVAVKDATSVSEARRMALLAAQRLDFDEERAGEVALLATEASRNVLIHGGGGQVIVMGIRDGDQTVTRILAMDKGPGIANIAQAFTDGYSTAGTMGGGMGAIKRMATTLEVFTGRSGTILMLEVGHATLPGPLRIAGIALPYPGERLCGDGWTVHHTPERMSILLVDGLGHGREAAEATQEAIAAFRARAHLPPGEILGYLHDALRKTRGAVAGIAEIRPDKSLLTYAGVGNIAAAVVAGDISRSLISHNGTLGMAMSRVQEFTMPWSSNSLLVMHSDGLQSRWDLSSYAGLTARHPAVIGGALLRDFRRQRDDASVVVVKAA